VELTTLSLAIISVWLIGWLMYWLTLRPKTRLESLLIKPIWICPNGHEIGASQPPDKYLCRKCPPPTYRHIFYNEENGKITESHNFDTYQNIADITRCPVCNKSLENIEKDIKLDINEETNKNNIKLSFSFNDLIKLRQEVDSRKTLDLTEYERNAINNLITNLKYSQKNNSTEPSNKNSTESSFNNLLNRIQLKTSKLQYSSLIIIILTIIILIALIPMFIKLDSRSNYWIQFSFGINIIRELLPLFTGTFLGLLIIFLSILYRIELSSKNFIKWFIDNLGTFTITIVFFIASLIIIILRKQAYKNFDFFEGIIVIAFNIVFMSLSAMFFSWINYRKIKQNLQSDSISKTYQTINNIYGAKINKLITIGNVEGNLNNR